MASFPRMHQTNNARFLDLLWRHVLSLGLLTAAFLVSYSRYEAGGPLPCTLPTWDPAGPHVGPLPGPIEKVWERAPHLRF